MLSSITVAPTPVAAGRMLLAGGALLTCLESTAYMDRLLDDRVRVPVAGWAPSPDTLPMGPWVAVSTIACFFLLLGVASGASALSVGLANILFLLCDQQLYSNHRFLLVLLCLGYAVARADRAWSLRSGLRRDSRTRSVPWWPQLLIVATVSSCYLFAGLSKVNPEFLTGDLIASMSPGWVPARATAWLTPPAEIAVGLGIWWRPTRRLALLLGVALHASIVVLLGSPLVFGAFALLCLSAYPLIWTWPDRDQREAAATQRSSAA